MADNQQPFSTGGSMFVIWYMIFCIHWHDYIGFIYHNGNFLMANEVLYSLPTSNDSPVYQYGCANFDSNLSLSLAVPPDYYWSR